MVGSDMQLRCLIDRDGNNTEIKTYKWNYTKPKNKTSKNTEKYVTFEMSRELYKTVFICVFRFDIRRYKHEQLVYFGTDSKGQYKLHLLAQSGRGPKFDGRQAVQALRNRYL